MKKRLKQLISLLLVVLLIGGTVSTVAAAGYDVTYALTNASGAPGDTVQIELSVVCDTKVSLLMLKDLTFNTAALELKKIEIDKSSPVISNAVSGGESVLYGNDVVLSYVNEMDDLAGDICTLTFKIKDNAAGGSYAVTGTFEALVSSNPVSCNSPTATITVSGGVADYSAPSISCTMESHDGFKIRDIHTLQDYVDGQWKVVREGTEVGVVGDDTVFTVKNNSGDSNVIVVLQVRAYTHYSGSTYRLTATGSWRPDGSLKVDVQGGNNQVGAISAKQSVTFDGVDLNAICPDASYYIIDTYLYDTSVGFDRHVGHGWYVVTHDNERAEEIMSGHTHKFNQKITSDEALKSEADCENAAVYYYSCACGEISTDKDDTFTSGRANGHDDDDNDGFCDACDEEMDDDDTGIWNNPFIDILMLGSSGKAIQYVYENGLFEGVSKNEFAPHMTMTRGMFVTVLGRMADIDEEAYYGSSFSDVQPGTWYAPGVAWASQNGIVQGYGNGIFGVNDEITVEQAVVILARYAKYLGIDITSDYQLTKFSDRNFVSPWAVAQMQWAVEQGIYDGSGKSLVPQKAASRELVAELIYHFATEYLD